MAQRSSSSRIDCPLLFVAIGCLFACSSGSGPSMTTAGGGGTPAAAGASAYSGAPPGGVDSGGAANAGGADIAGSAGAAGAAGSAGAAGAVGAAGAAAHADDQFTLRYRDDFETFDTARWQVMTHSWDTNLALFSQESVSVKDGHLVLALLPAPAGTVDSSGAAKSFLGAEVRSLDTLTYGRVRARIKLASGSAVVSSLVTLYTPWPADNWNELDIEHLGAQPSAAQFNTMVYTGAPVMLPATTSVSPTQEPHVQELNFAASDDFHTYTIEWTPASARFYVDDGLAYSWTKHIELMTLPQNVLLTIWASSSSAWAGPVTDATSQASASFDWVELYEYSAK